MSTRFDGKVALVTGGGSGIGRATAHAFAREGAAVMVAGRTADELVRTVKTIEEAGGNADFVTADVTSEDDVARMVATTVERFGGLHIAHNNAGVFGQAAQFADLDTDTWRDVLDVNVTGVFLAMKHEIRHMRGNGGGAIVNTSSSIGAHVRLPGLTSYATSKAAVSFLTRAAARDHIADGVRINAVSPGAVDAPMSSLPGETREERDTRLAPAIPCGRVGSLDEVAGTVLWLASAEAGFAVGHDLVIDGGGTA
ncbi:glucose 1-dehydrogenase [Actinomadura sp. 7K507]|uniref:SDR family NAD(P)-dependent oxidoreductase n=1 Tax=Actinomadura sp. 7K507 TaxID=2530365 RepID=UPI001046A4BE|nr:glucose 1-dehydrogenase [Actinomadura sp. 7K507]TDC81081.1 glucose 1-dehydrogenase [Actinomadura sp. 7K507]